eukprot:5693962-Prorocentrum_lima.AAC.1
MARVCGNRLSLPPPFLRRWSRDRGASFAPLPPAFADPPAPKAGCARCERLCAADFASHCGV